MKFKVLFLFNSVIILINFIYGINNIKDNYINGCHLSMIDTLKYKHMIPAPINTRIASYEFISPFIGILDMPEVDGQSKKQFRIIDIKLLNEIKWDEIEIQEGFKHKSLITLGTNNESFYVLSGGMVVYKLNSRGIIEREIVLEKSLEFSWMINSKIVVSKDKLFIILKSENCRINNTEGINCLRLFIYDLNGKIIKIIPIDNENIKSSNLSIFGNEVKIKLFNNHLLVFNSITNILLDYNLVTEDVLYKKLNDLDGLKAKNIKDIIIQNGIIKILSSDQMNNLYLVNFNIAMNKANILDTKLKNIFWASFEKKLCLRIHKTGLQQEIELFSLQLP